MSSPPIVRERFWSEVRSRRNRFWLTWVGWLFVGFPLWGLCWYLLPFKDHPLHTPASLAAALVIYVSYWRYTANRLSALKCYECDRPAIPHPFFRMEKAACQHCGARYAA